jgi:hypothetical protein
VFLVAFGLADGSGSAAADVTRAAPVTAPSGTTDTTVPAGNDEKRSGCPRPRAGFSALECCRRWLGHVVWHASSHA